MNKFQKYLSDLAEVEKTKAEAAEMKTSEGKILTYGGVKLNWLGDFFGNPKIKWEQKTLSINQILFSGTGPDWNEILIRQCERQPQKFQELVGKDPKLKNKFWQKVKNVDEIPILVRIADENPKKFQVLDGMHRFIKTVMENKKELRVYVPINEKKYLPVCERHTIYDLIRGFIRNAHDKAGEKELYFSLKLLARTYSNVVTDLKERFNQNWVRDEKAQAVIQKVIKESEK
jgi:hypothetical protein